MRPMTVVVLAMLGIGACASSSGGANGAADAGIHDGAGPGGDALAADVGADVTAPSDTVGTDTVTGDTANPTDTGTTDDAVSSDTADATAAPFACGHALTCTPPQACEAIGQGACGGPAPNPDGSCAPGCSATDCGGSMHCLCTSYNCIDLPAGCQGCNCTWTDWHTSCQCDDSAGGTQLDCPGA